MALNPNSRPNPAKIVDEQVKCLELKRQGLTVRAIAALVKLPKTTVQERLDAAFAELLLPPAEEVRKLELERLDAWQLRLEQRLDQGEDPIRVIPVGLKVLERRAKLLGLDAPIQVDATFVETTQADLELQDMIRAARVANAVERSELGGSA
jgi:hypothetical protein